MKRANTGGVTQKLIITLFGIAVYIIGGIWIENNYPSFPPAYFASYGSMFGIFIMSIWGDDHEN